MSRRGGGLSPVQRFIVDRLAQHPRDIASITAKHFRITRQAVNRQLRSLVAKRLLTATGETKSRTYGFAVLGQRKAVFTISPDLQEDLVWQERVAPVITDVPENVRDICNYGFTEMLNNAKDHSGSETVVVSVEYTLGNIEMRVTDFGIGIFRKIKEACGLEDERHVILELVKGKLTTDPERHTGEGIFFTSRMFDYFSILSGRLYLGHGRDEEDWLLEDKSVSVSGTHVRMQMSPRSTHTTTEVFKQYATDQDDYAFAKTHVVVALAQSQGEKLVSRSQAKRVVARLERFREVVLDFKGVTMIGPAFADEIFRVFRARHPQVNIIAINMNQDVGRMVRRAESATAESSDAMDQSASDSSGHSEENA